MDYLETKFPITAVAISEAGNELFSGGIDNDIKVYSSPVSLASIQSANISVKHLGMGPPKTRRRIYYARPRRHRNLAQCLS